MLSQKYYLKLSVLFQKNKFISLTKQYMHYKQMNILVQKTENQFFIKKKN